MSTGTTTNVADIFAKAQMDDTTIATDQARLQADQEAGAIDHKDLSQAVAQYPNGCVVQDALTGQYVYARSDGSGSVITVPVPLFTPSTPSTPGMSPT